MLLALDRACRVMGAPPMGIDEEAIAQLLEHDWPGNLRELQHVIDRAVQRAEGTKITATDLPPLPRARRRPDPLEGTYAEMERHILERAMRRAGGNKSEAARMLDLKRTTFLDKLRRQGIEGGSVPPPPPKSTKSTQAKSTQAKSTQARSTQAKSTKTKPDGKKKSPKKATKSPRKTRRRKAAADPAPESAG